MHADPTFFMVEFLTQVAAFEVRNRTFLRWMVTNQFEFQVGNIPEALDFHESEVQPYERIARAGPLGCRQKTDSPKDGPDK
jgi:hypothetical protein